MPFADAFNRGGELLHIDSNWSNVDAGSRDRLKVNNNRVESNGTATSRAAYKFIDVGFADMYVQCNVIQDAGRSVNSLFCVRLVDRDNYIGCLLGATPQTGYEKRVATVQTALSGSPFGADAGTIRQKLEIVGTTVSVYRDVGAGFVLLGSDTVADAVFSGVTTCGFIGAGIATDGIPLYDNFECGPLIRPPTAWVRA